MNLKKIGIMLLITAIVGAVIFLIVNNFIGKDDKKKQNPSDPNTSSDIITIDYQTYQELRSKVHDGETFGILISDDTDASKTFREEVIYSFQDRKSKLYEIKYSELTEVEQSGVIADVSNLKEYNPPEIKLPTLLVSKQGKVVYINELLAYSPEIIAGLDKNKIE